MPGLHEVRELHAMAAEPAEIAVSLTVEVQDNSDNVDGSSFRFMPWGKPALNLEDCERIEDMMVAAWKRLGCPRLMVGEYGFFHSVDAGIVLTEAPEDSDGSSSIMRKIMRMHLVDLRYALGGLLSTFWASKERLIAAYEKDMRRIICGRMARGHKFGARSVNLHVVPAPANVMGLRGLFHEPTEQEQEDKRRADRLTDEDLQIVIVGCPRSATYAQAFTQAFSVWARGIFEEARNDLFARVLTNLIAQLTQAAASFGIDNLQATMFPPPPAAEPEQFAATNANEAPTGGNGDKTVTEASATASTGGAAPKETKSSSNGGGQVKRSRRHHGAAPQPIPEGF